MDRGGFLVARFRAQVGRKPMDGRAGRTHGDGIARAFGTPFFFTV